MARTEPVITPIELDVSDAIRSAEQLNKRLGTALNNIDWSKATEKQLKLADAIVKTRAESDKLLTSLKSMQNTRVQTPEFKALYEQGKAVKEQYDAMQKPLERARERWVAINEKISETKGMLRDYKQDLEAIQSGRVSQGTPLYQEIFKSGNLDAIQKYNEKVYASVEKLPKQIAAMEKEAKPITKTYMELDDKAEELYETNEKIIAQLKQMRSEGTDTVPAEETDIYKEQTADLEALNRVEQVQATQLENMTAAQDGSASSSNEQARMFRTLAFSLRNFGTIGNRVIPGFSKMLTPVSAGLRIAARGTDELKASVTTLLPVLMESMAVIAPIVALLAAIGAMIKIFIGYLKVLYGTMVNLIKLGVKEMAVLTKGLAILSKYFAKFVGILGRGLISGLGLAVKGFKNLFLAIHNFNMGLLNGIKNIFAFVTGINGVSGAMNWLKSTITSTIPIIAQMNGGANSVNRAMSMLVSSLTQMKNAWGAAFTPILTTVAPILNYLIQLLTKVAETIGAFFSALTGKPFIKAKKVNIDYAASLDKSAKSTKKLKDETDELLGKLGAYDELNVIGEDKTPKADTDTPDAGGGLGADDMFETAKIPDKIKDFVDQLKKAWANEDWDWFEEQGFKAADWLADQLEKAIEWMDTKGMEYARKLGLALASFLNGVFKNLRLAKDIGEFLASAINMGLEFAYNFLTKFNFRQFGVFISTGLMAAIRKVDWAKLGKSIALGINGLFDTIKGILDAWDTGAIVNAFSGLINNMIFGINWAENGKTLSNAIYKVFDTAAKAIKSIRWDDLGRGLATFLNNQEWGKQLDAIGTAISSALNGINDAIEGFLKSKPFDKVAKGLGYALNNLFTGKNKINLNKIGKNIAEIINQIFSMFGKFAENFDGREVGVAIGNGFRKLFENLDPKQAATDVSNFIMEVLHMGVATINTSKLPELGTKIGEFFGNIKWNEILPKAGEGIRTFLTNVAQFGINLIDSGGLAEFASSLGQALTDIFNDTTMWSQIGELVGKSISTLFEVIRSLIEGGDNSPIANALNAFFEGATSNMDVNAIAQTIADVISWATTQLQTFMGSEAFQSVASAINQLATTALAMVPWSSIMSTLMAYVIPALMDAFGTISVMLPPLLLKIAEDCVNGFIQGLTLFTLRIILVIGKFILDLIDKVKALLGIHSPSTVFADIGENVMLGLLEGLNSMKESLLQWWENIKTSIHEKVEALKAGVQEKWQALKDKVTEITDNIKTSLQEKWEWIKEKITTVVEETKSWVIDKWNALKDTLSGVWESIKSTALSIWEGLKSGIIGIISSIGTAIGNFVTNTINAVKEAKNALLGLNDAGSSAAGTKAGINTVVQSAKDKYARYYRYRSFVPMEMATMSMMSDLGIRGDSSWSSPSSIEIPALASGAVIPPNKEFAAILGDQKQGVNIESPLQTMIDAFNTALAENGLAGGGSTQPPIVLQLNGKTIAQAVWDEEEKQYKQNVRR